MGNINLAGALLVVLLVSAVTAYPQPATEEKKKTVAVQESAKENRFVAVVDADGIQRATVVGGEYYFDPNHIVVKVNIPVELSVKKDGGYIPHDITVKAPEAGIDFSESLGKNLKVIKFTPKTVGKYEMFCSKKLPFAKSHKDRGMDGVIEVVP